jgi:ATP-dependent protease ClpP protease subunit
MILQKTNLKNQIQINNLTGEAMKNTSNFFDLTKIAGGSGNYYGPKPLANIHEFYLCGEIHEASEYIDWFNTIRHADENDVIRIYINSPGGDLYTAIQFMRVMSETNAHIIASVEGACMSAATMIFLCADSYEVTPHSVFMFHNYSGGTVGKGGEMISQLVHQKKWTERIFNTVYSGFLSESEIKNIIEDKDIWMDGDEVVTRINKMMAEQEKKAKRELREIKPKTKGIKKVQPDVDSNES